MGDEGKGKVIGQIENGEKKVNVYREFGLVYPMIRRICRNRIKIISAFEQNGWGIKRFQKPERSDVDEALH